MVTCYSNILSSFFIVAFYFRFLLSGFENASGETFFAASLPGADKPNALFGLHLDI